MTLVLITKSGEELDSGFYEAFMKLSRIGKYSFETKDLCSLAQNLAENPELKKARLFGYDTERVWELERRYNSLFMLKRVSSIIEKNTDELDDFIQQNRELSAEEKIEIMKDKIDVPVEVHRLEKFVKIGEYEIENFHFVSMICYILRGGFNGWRQTPDFAKSALVAMQLSKNPLYNRYNLTS